MIKTSVTFALLQLLLWPAAFAWATPSPVSADLEVLVGTAIGADQDEGGDATSVVFPTTQGVTLSTEARSSEDQNFARAFERVSATFAPYRGTIDLEFGVEVENPDRLGAHAVVAGHDPWSYTFVPDQDSVLVFEYDFSGTGNLRFVSSFNPAVRLVGSGSIHRDLQAGQSFTIGLDLFAGPSCFGSCDGFSESGVGAFGWSIVPEPSTFTLVTLGLLALVLRRRCAV